MTIIESNLSFGKGSVRRGDPNGIILHHAAAKAASVETVHGWHKDKGWIGIGYHFYVRKDGKVYRGRPENWVGAHTVGHNSSKLGICAEGNFENEKMPEAQKEAIIELLAYLFGKYGDLKVYGHRDLSSTACPGKNFPFAEIVNGAKNYGKAEAETKPKEENTVNVELKVLSRGAEGAQVKTLQRVLVGMGYDLGKYGVLKNGVDGDFGDATYKAVRNFQKINNLGVDGIVGKETWNKLLKG